MGYDVDGAKQLLDSAGWRVTGSDSVRTKGGKRLAFAVLTQANNQAQQHAATIIQDQLRKVGVQLTVNPVEFQVLAQHFRSKKFDALILGFQADASPSGIRQNWSSESARSEGGFNRSGYLSPAFDATNGPTITVPKTASSWAGRVLERGREPRPGRTRASDSS